MYAFRADSQDHGKYKLWLEDVVNSPAAFGLSPQVLSSVVRICTHPRIFAKPTRLDEALEFCEALLGQPNVSLITPTERHWAVFVDLCQQAKATGNLVQDAWLAALAIESGCEWITTDRDFARFPGLQWRPPF